MRDHTVTLHLSEADTAHFLSSFDRLVREYVIRTASSCLALIGDHVPQSLVVNDTNVDVDLHLLTINARVHGLVTKIVVTMLSQFFAEVVDCIIIYIAFKWLNISEFPV